MAATVAAVALLCILIGVSVLFFSRRYFAGQLDLFRENLSKSNLELSTLKTELDSRLDELRRSASEIRDRETEAKHRVQEIEQRLSDAVDELKKALEEKGKFENEATRVDELKAIINCRDETIALLNVRIIAIEREKTETIKDAEAARALATDMIAMERESHKQIVNAKTEQLQKVNEFITQARSTLSTEFKALSADALKDVSAQLAFTADTLIQKHGEKATADIRLHKQEIETILKPVEETIKRLDKQVEESNANRSRAEALLDDQVKRLAGASEALTTALRKPVIKGSWGEMTLENALESAGLQPEIDFVLQDSTSADDGIKRTDAVVNLPKGRKLVIDSKNLMDSYLAICNAETDAERASLEEAHSKAFKGHMKALCGKEYWKRYDGLDCVILFVPHEGMYHAAIQDEREVIREASEKRVFISNPMTLMPLLKAVRFILDQERLNQSAEEIKNVGAELYSELTRFARNVATVGDRLKSTVRAYNDAIPGLDRYIVSKSRKLKQLGSSRGPGAELPDLVGIEPQAFSSPELKEINAADGDMMPEGALAATNSSVG